MTLRKLGALFASVRERVTALEAAEAYGLEVTRFGKARCPWHADRHPSLSFDKRTGRCKCFSCGAGGDSIDLTAKLLGISPLEAAQKINTDFGLFIVDSKNRLESTPTGENPVERRRREKRERMHRYCVLCDQEQEARAVLARFTPETSENSPEFEDALRRYCIADLKIESMGW